MSLFSETDEEPPRFLPEPLVGGRSEEMTAVSLHDMQNGHYAETHYKSTWHLKSTELHQEGPHNPHCKMAGIHALKPWSHKVYGSLDGTVKPKPNVSVGTCTLVNVSRHQPYIVQHCRTWLLSKTSPPKSAQLSVMEHC